MIETVGALVAAKAALSIGIVVALSLIAERVGPRAAGLLTGLPLGAGMVIIFTGIEQGPVFAAEAAHHMVPGFSTTLVFIAIYAAVAASRNEGGLKAIIAPSIAANVGYAMAAYAVSLTQIPLIFSLPGIAVLLIATSKLMAYLPNTPIVTRVRFGWGVLMFRAFMAAAAIVIISAAASAIGPQWTGILTAFPITLYPLILVIHITYRGEEIAAVLKHVPLGLGGVISFCWAVTWGLPTLGLFWGALLGYAAAITYLSSFAWVSRAWRRRGA